MRLLVIFPVVPQISQLESLFNFLFLSAWTSFMKNETSNKIKSLQLSLTLYQFSFHLPIMDWSWLFKCGWGVGGEGTQNVASFKTKSLQKPLWDHTAFPVSTLDSQIVGFVLLELDIFPLALSSCGTVTAEKSNSKLDKEKKKPLVLSLFW